MARLYPSTAIAVCVVLMMLFLIFYIPSGKLDLKKAEEFDGKNEFARLHRVDSQLPKNETVKVKEKKVKEKQVPQDTSNNAENMAGEEKSSESSASDSDTRQQVPWDSVTVNVLLCSDSNTLGGLIATVNSISLNTAAHVKYYILVDDKSIDHLRTWLSQTQLKDLDYKLKVFNSSLVEDKIVVRDARQELASPLNFARNYFPVEFPEIQGKLIFIDSDSIVNGDIMELAQLQIAKGQAAAFSDDCSSISHRSTLVQTNYASFLNFLNPTIKGLKMNPMTCSFNTGVFVADVKEWKAQKITEKLDKWMKLNVKEELYGLQKGGGSSGPPYMIVFYNNYTKLSPAWNVRHLGVSSGIRYSDSFVKSAKLLHWNGPFKPWTRSAQHTTLWDKYYIPDPTGEFKVVRIDKTF